MNIFSKNHAAPDEGPKRYEFINPRTLWILGIGLPVLFWSAVLIARMIWLPNSFVTGLAVFELSVIVVGAVLFWKWAIGVLSERQDEIERRTRQLESLHAAALTLTTELDLSAVLQKVVDLSRELVNAQYGALGVLDEEGQTIAQFVTSGISSEEHVKIGALPKGRGLLGVLIREGKPIRVPDVQADERSVGFPPHHPPMHSFLGMPIRSKGKIIGNLYLADKLIGDGEHVHQVPFTQQDQDILEMFATQAAIAIENAHLYRQSEQLAVLQERERFGMDLHDGIIQSIYAIGLMLEDAQHRSATDPDQARRLVAQSITGLNNVISDIRNYILDLRPQRFQGRDLSRGLRELAREVRANSFLDVALEIDPLPQCSLPAEVTVEVLHVVQEALSNIQKHAQARHVQIRSFCSKDRLFLSVMDDGNGIDPEAIDQATGNGIRNMRERIRNHGGTFEIEPGPKGGTVVSLSVPLGSDETEFAETVAESRRAV